MITSGSQYFYVTVFTPGQSRILLVPKEELRVQYETSGSL